MQYVVLTALIAISLLTPTRAADVSLHGRILDEHGKPVAGVAIDNWWSANGTLRQVDGTIIDVKSVGGEQAFRGDIGKMEPKRFPPAESAADGSFELKVPDYALAVLAFDRQRERGALIAVSREVRRDALVVTHASHRDQFELIAFCISIDNEYPSMKEIDEPLARFSKLVWKGRTPQFPVVVDNTMQTWDRLGLWGWGNLLLIDPEGRLVKGNLKTLSETLNQP